MKCSHGTPFEMKCAGCFNDAMALYPRPTEKKNFQFVKVNVSEQDFVPVTLNQPQPTHAQ